MIPLLRSRGLFVLVVCLVAFASGALMSRENLMQRLPVYERFKCLLCHKADPSISGKTDLNPFGVDFRDNDYTWDPILAAMDSDNDGFTNGFELGDDQGNHTPSVSRERSNPGDPHDRPSSVNEETWGVIKKLFADTHGR